MGREYYKESLIRLPIGRGIRHGEQRGALVCLPCRVRVARWVVDLHDEHGIGIPAVGLSLDQYQQLFCLDEIEPEAWDSHLFKKQPALYGLSEEKDLQVQQLLSPEKVLEFMARVNAGGLVLRDRPGREIPVAVFIYGLNAIETDWHPENNLVVLSLSLAQFTRANRGDELMLMRAIDSSQMLASSLFSVSLRSGQRISLS